MTRTRTWFLLNLSLLGCQAGDGGAGPDSGPVNLPHGVITSAPVPRAAAGAAGTGSLVFVAVTPASFPGAASAIVRGEGGDSAIALVRDGGFDPLPVAGEPGEYITFSIVDSGGQATDHQVSVKKRPTRVVRTNPMPNRTDVPLNVRISVVFSAPVDSESARLGIRLWQGNAPVTGETHLTPDALAVEFIPAAVLSPGTAYELRVDGSIRDVLGAPIAEPVAASFQTGSAIASVGSLFIVGHEYPWVNRLVAASRLEVGQSIDLYATTGGPSLFNTEPSHWTTSNPAVVRVTERSAAGFAIEEGVGPGRAFVQVEADGLLGRMLVEVFRPLRPGMMGTQVYVDHYTSVWRQRVDGAQAVQLLATSELPRDSTLCASAITLSCYLFPHMFAVSPTGRIAVTRASDIGGVWIKDGAGGALRQVNTPGERGAAHSPAWSPSGDRLAYWFDFFPEAVTELRVVSSDGTGQRVLARMPYETNPPILGDPAWASRPTGGASVVWHPDGERLLMATPEGTVQIRIDGSGTLPYLSGYQPGPWFPDGQVQFVFKWAEPPEYGVRVFRATADGVVDPNTAFEADYLPIAVSPDGLLMADWGAVFTIDRTGSAEVTGYGVDHLIGFVH